MEIKTPCLSSICLRPRFESYSFEVPDVHVLRARCDVKLFLILISTVHWLVIVVQAILYDSSDEPDEYTVTPVRRRQIHDRNDPEYQARRARNKEAVRKCRAKKKEAKLLAQREISILESSSLLLFRLSMSGALSACSISSLGFFQR
jgi:hypothetical protein